MVGSDISIDWLFKLWQGADAVENRALNHLLDTPEEKMVRLINAPPPNKKQRRMNAPPPNKKQREYVPGLTAFARWANVDQFN